jgi:hypothetical protein
MAFIINRNNEISDEKFSALKEKFNAKTNTQAIYKGIEFLVNELPKVEKQLSQKEEELQNLSGKFETFVDTYKRKQAIDSQIGTIVYPEQP